VWEKAAQLSITVVAGAVIYFAALLLAGLRPRQLRLRNIES